MSHCMLRSIYYTNFQSRLINYNIFVVERYDLRRRLSTDNGTRWLAEIILNVWIADKMEVFCVT